MTRQSGAERHRAAHRALATTRAQLGAAVALATLVGLAVVPLAARADQGGQEWTPASRLLDDSFDAEGRLGQAPVGGPWTPWSSRGASLIADDGALQVDGLSGGSAFVLSARAARASDVLVSSTVRAVPSGGAYYAGSSTRMQSDGSRYAATVTVRPSGEVVLTAERVSASGTTGLGRTTTTAPLGTPLRIDLQTTGGEPTQVRARVYAEGTAAPDWQVSADDTGSEAITAAGSVGIGGYLARAASDVDLSVDAVQAWALVPGVPGTDGGTVTPPPTTSPTSVPASTGGAAPPTPAESPPAAPPATAPSTSAAPTSAAPTTAPAGPTATPQASSTSAAPVGTSAVRPTTSDAGFQHPGVVVSADQLAFVRSQIAAGREPWTSSLARTRSSSYAKPTWTPRPVAQVQCGAYNNPDVGCTAETDDAQAAYTNALLFSLTGERRYADKAVQILDAWSGTLQGHSFDTSLYRNGRLQASWAGQTFTKAAELLRYSGAGWSPASVDRFEQMLRSAFLPLTRDGGNGCANCQLSMAEATTSIGVFLDDRAVFDEGIADWRAQLPAAFYVSSDGPKPVIPPGSTVKVDTVDRYWKFPARYVDGLGAETCRDLGHTAMGLGAAFNTAETAEIQGLDLYTEQQQRLVSALELNSRFLVDPGASGWVCPAPPATGGSAGQLTGWVGLQHYTQEGVAMPETERWLSRNEPSRTGIFMNWESLTHGS